MTTTEPLETTCPKPLWASAERGAMPTAVRAVAPPSAAATKATLADLRRFHYGGPAIGGGALPDGIQPALLWPRRPTAAEAETSSSASPLAILHGLAQPRVADRRARFGAKVAALHDRLLGLLRGAGGADREPATLHRALGAAAGRLVDASALARVAGHAPLAAPMSPARRQRIEAALGSLSEALRAPHDPAVVMLFDEAVAGRREPLPDTALEVRADACEAAAVRFDEAAERVLPVVRAMRTARLELENGYDEARHDAWLAALGWEALSADELLGLPVVIAVADAQRLEQGELASWTRLLLSGRPVQIVVEVDAARGPALAAAAGHGDHRLELALLGVAHRHAHVHQSATASPEHLAAAFEAGLDGLAPALHVVSGGTGPRALAAIEARAHPLLHHDPGAGRTLARRLDLGGNPQPESVWPTYPLACRHDDGSEETLLVAFTFADFALTEPALHAHFAVVPDSVPIDALVPIADHVVQDGDKPSDRLPFVWAVRGDGRLLRLLVSRPLALECRDRADTWGTLQELAGVRSDALAEAVQRTRSELSESNRVAMTAQEQQHQAALEATRAQSVAAAMRQLAESLLSDDPGEFARRLAGGAPQGNGHVAPPAPAAVAPPEVSASPVRPEPEPEPAAAAAPATEGPWVDTPLCTSCDDCVRLNPLLFVYDDNKQVRIGDPRAGTYAQLVKAAEKCPGRCIHPGEPLNSNEPGLEALRKRAAAFQ